MNAQEFIAAWKEFAQRFGSGEDLATAWHGKTAWTHRTIGPACVSQTDSPLGKFLADRLGGGWRFLKEYWHVDLALARKPNMPRPYLWKEDEQVLWDSRFEPIVPDILIEHEDACGISWEEMIKLILLRSRLKVLITYTTDVHDERSRAISEEHIAKTRTQFEGLLDAAWRTTPECEGTEYVLIIGQLEGSGPGARVNWYCSSFSARGTLDHQEFYAQEQPQRHGHGS